jgi:hypothetical protein
MRTKYSKLSYIHGYIFVNNLNELRQNQQLEPVGSKKLRLRGGSEDIPGKSGACGERPFRRALGHRRRDKLRSRIGLRGAAVSRQRIAA